MYKTPEKYYFRLHHIRPRFKKDIENVLIYVASELVELGNKPHDEFKNLFNEKLRLYPGNQIKELKTINNWRTEITSLFGFVQKDETSTYASLRAKELADNSDLVQTFKKFLYLFQYPGGHLKPHENQKLIEAGIKFKPVKYILELLVYAEKKEQKLKQEAEKKFKESAELIRFLTSKIKENLEKPKYEFFTREQTNLDELVKEVESKMTPEEIKEIKLQLEKEMNTVYDDEL